MSSVSRAGGGGGPAGAGMPSNFVPFEEDNAPVQASGVAGTTTLFVLVASVLAMGLGADAQRILLTVTISFSIYALINYSPSVGVPIMMGYQTMIGGIKRYSLPILGYSSYDPFLVVAPAVISLMFIARIAKKDVPRDTPLSKAIFAMIAIMFLEVFNPLQGGLAIGLGGAMYCIIPVLWFYCGRYMGSPTVVTSLLKAIVVVAVLGAIYGLKQQFFGFSDIEWEWLRITKNDNGLYLTKGVMRVFSFFGSFAEYAHFLLLATVVAFAMFLDKKPAMVLPWAFLMVAVVLASSRGTLLSALFGCCLVWSIQGKNPKVWAPRVAIAVVIGIAALVTGLRQTETVNADVTTESLLEHQRRGLLAPLEKKSSTGGVHINLIVGGIIRGFTNPLGQGLGAPTIAAGKAGVEGVGSEADFSDMFISCGAVGGCIYLFLIVYSLYTSLRLWHKYRHSTLATTFGILFVALTAWSVTARYAEPMIVWFLVGYLDRLHYTEIVTEYQKRRAEYQARQAEAAATAPTPRRA